MKFAAALATLLAIATPAFSQPDELALLRDSLKLPSMPFWIGVMFDPQEGTVWSTPEHDYAEVRRLEASLKSEAEDAPKWREVIVGYQRLQRPKEHQRACEKALPAFQKLGQARPNDIKVALLALDGKALPGEEWNLKWLEDFEKKHPTSPEIRARIGVEKVGKALRLLIGDDMVKLVLMQEIATYSQDPDRDRKADAALALLTDAARDFREARKRSAAPGARMFVQEADALNLAYIIERIYAGRPFTQEMARRMHESLSLLQQAREREPRSPEVAAFTLNVLRVTCKDFGEGKELDKLVRAQLDILKSLADDVAQPRVAALAHEILAGVIGQKDGFVAALPNFKGAAALDPMRTRSVEFVVPLLEVEDEKDEALRRAQAYLQWKDTNRARYLLCKMLHVRKQYKEAMEHLAVILERDPEDVRGRVGMAIVALQTHHEDKGRLDVARTHLEWAEKCAGLDEDQRTEVKKARAAYCALTGDKVGAVKLLTELANRPNADAHAKLMLLALRGYSEPTTPGLSRSQRERLCTRLPMPMPRNSLSFRFGSSIGFGWEGEILSEQAEIEKLLSREKKEPLNGEELHRLGLLLEYLDRKGESATRYQQALAWAETKLKAEPNEGRWHWLLAKAKLDTETMARVQKEGRKGEYQAEKDALLMDLAKRWPGTWQIWSELADSHYNRATAALYGFDKIADKDFSPLLALAQYGRPPADRVRVIRQHLQQGNECAQKAVDAAPQNTEVYARRFSQRLQPVVMVHMLKVTEDLAELANPNEVIGDLMEIAKRRTDDSAYCTKAVMLKAVFSSITSEHKGKLSEYRDFLSPAEREWVEKLLAHVEAVSRRTDNPKAAAEACENLVRWHFVLLPNSGKMLDYAKRAVELDPERPGSWELVALSFLHNRQRDECLRVCSERVRRFPSEEARLFHGLMLLDSNKMDDAVKELEAALGLNPKLVQAQVALLGIHLCQSLVDPAAMTRAKTMAEALKTRNERELNKDERLQCKFFEAAYWALEGQTALAERLLGEILKESEEHAAAKDFVRILRGTPLVGN